VALGFIDALERVYAVIGAAPATGSPRWAHELNLPGLRTYRLKGYPWLVFYIEQSEHIDVWRILHSKRDIPVGAGRRSSFRTRRVHHIDRMAPAAAIAVVGRVAGVVPRDQTGTRQIRDRAADIGAAHGQDLLLDRLVDPRGIAGFIAGEFMPEARLQRGRAAPRGGPAVRSREAAGCRANRAGVRAFHPGKRRDRPALARRRLRIRVEEPGRRSAAGSKPRPAPRKCRQRQ
jgi:plasmid stabilization system protein ParE